MDWNNIAFECFKLFYGNLNPSKKIENVENVKNVENFKNAKNFGNLCWIGFKEPKISQEIARNSRNPFKTKEKRIGCIRFLKNWLYPSLVF